MVLEFGVVFWTLWRNCYGEVGIDGFYLAV